MLELRLQEPAAPARVARAAHMFARVLEAIGAAAEVGTTLVVENKFLKATIRTRTPQGASAVNSVIDLVRNPLSTQRPHPARSELAAELAEYARDEGRYHPQLWKPGAKEPLCNLDETFAAMMEAIAIALPAGSNVVRGTTYVFSKVYRVGRTDDQRPMKARITIEGRPLEVRVDDEVARDLLFDAARRDSVVRLRLAAEWIHHPNEAPRIRTAVVTGIDTAAESGAGARLIALARAKKVITAEDLPAVLSSIARDREDGSGE